MQTADYVNLVRVAEDQGISPELLAPLGPLIDRRVADGHGHEDLAGVIELLKVQHQTVIGLGPMGQAMVRAFLGNGHPTTVWNRTASRADDLVAEGAVRAATVADAVATNELVILSPTDYQAMYEILGLAGDALTGRVVVSPLLRTKRTTAR